MARSTQGFDKLEKRLARIPKLLRDETTRALVRSAEETAGVQRTLAPVSEDGSHGNPPGALRGSIVVTPPGGTTPGYSQPGGMQSVPAGAAVVTAGNERVRYPHLVEFGTSRASAQPFFWPGFRLTRTKNQRRIKRALNKAIKDSKNG